MTWSRTRSGVRFDYLHPTVSMINIEDIAGGLSKECRFNGQCIGFYSVSQHSELCSWLVPPKFALEALLHDAAEAYCKDITHPHKQLLPDYKVIERRVDLVIRQKFGLPFFISPEVKHADMVMLVTEYRDIMPEYRGDLGDYIDHTGADIQPVEILISPMDWREAHASFIDRFNELTDYDYMSRPSAFELSTDPAPESMGGTRKERTSPKGRRPA